MTIQQVSGGHTHVHIKGDFDRIEATTETVAMAFIGGTAAGVDVSDFYFA